MLVLTRNCFPKLGYVKGAEVTQYTGDVPAVEGTADNGTIRYDLVVPEGVTKPARLWLTPKDVIDPEDQSDPRNAPEYSDL